MLQMFEQKLKFKNAEYPPLTLAVWSFLWVADSPIVKGNNPE
jgi:hypothetical protein